MEDVARLVQILKSLDFNAVKWPHPNNPELVFYEDNLAFTEHALRDEYKRNVWLLKQLDEAIDIIDRLANVPFKLSIIGGSWNIKLIGEINET